MTSPNRPTPNTKTLIPDAIREFTDSSGDRWQIGAEFKKFNERLDIASITIRSLKSSTSITRRLLSEIPLEKLFRDDLAVETEILTKSVRNRKGTTAHQGRAHQESELRAVSALYMAAYQARIPVQQYVADALGVSVSTAAKRIMAARRSGFITTHKGAK